MTEGREAQTCEAVALEVVVAERPGTHLQSSPLKEQEKRIFIGLGGEVEEGETWVLRTNVVGLLNHRCPKH